MRAGCLGSITTACSALALTGCTGMAGIGGSSSYACQAPEGVTCNSVSGVYANAIRNNLPGQQSRAPAPALELPSGASVGAGPAAPAKPGKSTSSLEDLRSPPRVLRLWFKAWEDADHDLFDQGYVYVRVDDGRWRIDHVQKRIRDGFAPIRPRARREGSQSGSEAKVAPRSSSDAPQWPKPVDAPAGASQGNTD